ncbi:MAG: DUF4432 family protein [Sphaerochaetaceae bacterium]|nr:DUF4432 family protein [Sphaerochaetaceae bacterium]
MLEEMQYVGNINQLFSVREVVLVEGKSKGVRVIEVNNGSGLYFEINVDRGFDIPTLRYKGINCGYESQCGNSSPAYFDDKELGFLKNFNVGFLTTCGLKSIGSPSTYNNKEYGLHGNISNIPSEHYYYKYDNDEKGEFVELNATLFDSGIFEDKLRLDRKIKCYYKKNKIIIDDTVTNEGFNKAIHNILYHMNFGYPLLSKESKMYIDSEKITPRTKRAEDLLSLYNVIEDAACEYEEACYYHNLKRNSNGDALVGVYNPKLKMGIAIKIDCKTLDHLVEWKLMKKRDYVLGLEPASNLIDGLADLDEKGLLKYLEAGDNINYHLEVEVVEDYKDFDKIFNS